MAAYLRGALVEMMPTGLIPLPNIITFQYNPETLTHTWTQAEPDKTGTNDTTTNPLAVKGDPGETFTFTLALDAQDTIAAGGPGADLAVVSGVYPRLAALEMLLYPNTATTSTSGLLGSVTAAISAAAGGFSLSTQSDVPAKLLNIVLFIWGPERIVPVRVTALTVTEKYYDVALNPVRAEAQITLKVLTQDELDHDTSDSLAKVGKAANTYTQGLRQAQALANTIFSVADGIAGMIPT
jgi:hypothetical protein